MKDVAQVWPVETPKPRQLVCSALRHYQKQSLAFMLAIEQDEKAPVGRDCVDSLISISPIVGPYGLVPRDSYHQPTEKTWYDIRGGWLCDEVGMGKTIVSMALILANPCPNPATKKMIQDMETYQAGRPGYPRFDGRVFTQKKKSSEYMGIVQEYMVDTNEKSKEWKTYVSDKVGPYNKALQKWKENTPPQVVLKLTLIYMPCSLLGQWRDEFKKFAPTLKVASFHSSGEKAQISSGKLDLHTLDVLLCTRQTGPPPVLKLDGVTCHRVMCDESHLGLYFSIVPLLS